MPGRSRALLECRASARLGLDRDRVRRRRLGGTSRCAFSRPAISAPTPNCCSPIPRRPRASTTSSPKSTYGDTDRRCDDAGSAPRSVSRPRFATPQPRKGALLIPAFAVERTQELIVDLVDLMERGEIPAAPIFLDSPLAIRATEVFRRARRKPRSDDRRSPAVQLAASAVHRDRRRKQGDREADRLSHHHRRERHVRRRPYPASSQALAVEQPGPPCCWSASRRRARSAGFSSGRRQGGPDPGRRDQGGGAASACIDDYSGSCRRLRDWRAGSRHAARFSAGCFSSTARSRRSPAWPSASPSGSFRRPGVSSRCSTTSTSSRPPRRRRSTCRPPPPARA